MVTATSAIRGRIEVPHTHGQDKDEKRSGKQHRLAKRRQGEQDGGGQPKDLIGNLAVEPHHSIELEAAKPTHNSDKGRGRNHAKQ